MALRKVLNGTICRKGVAYIINSHTKTKTACERGNLQKICGLRNSETKTTCVYGNLDVREWLTHFTETNPYKDNGGRFDSQNCFSNNM